MFDREVPMTEPLVMTTGMALRALVTDDMDVRTRALLIEAARTADRLDDLDEIIHGKGVLELLRFRLSDDEGRVAEVKFDGVLAEARQQAGTLKALLVTLGVDKIEVKAGGGSILDQLAARRAERQAEAATRVASNVDL